MKRKLISILLTAALVVGLLPATALAAEGETPAPVVYVGGVGLAAGQYYVNCATEAVTEKPAIWNAELAYTNGTDDTGGYTLTINNLAVRGVTDQYGGAAIYSTADLTIVLQGANCLFGAYTTSENAASAGIYAVGDLTITGAGALSTVGGEATGAGSNSYGIYAGGSVNITDTTASPTVKATGGGAGCNYGIYAEGGTAAHTVYIENATVVATGGAIDNATGGTDDGTSSAETSAGIRGGPANGGSSSIYITGDNTIVNATGGTSADGAVAYSYGLFGGTTGNITIAGGTVVATGGATSVTGGNGESCGIDTNGSALTVTGEDTVLVACTGIDTSGTVTRKAIDGDLDLGDTAKIAGATSDGTSMVTDPSTDNVGDYLSLAIVPSGWTDTLPTTVNNTLTLTGNTYIVTAAAIALSLDASTTIKTGDYTLLAVSLYEGAEYTAGINANETLTIDGNGGVIAVGGRSAPDDGNVHNRGVAGGDIKNNATLVAIAGLARHGSYGVLCDNLTNGDDTNSTATLTAIGGSITDDFASSYGISVGEGITNYAVLTGIAGNSAFGNTGVGGGDILKNEKNATLTAVCGASASAIGYGVSLNNGTIENRGVLSIACASYSGYGVSSYSGIITNEKDATLNAITGTGSALSVRECKLTNNGILTATAGTGYGVYINGGNLTNNATLTATAVAANRRGKSYGVYSTGTLTNNADATLTATAGPASSESYGVYSTVTITNSAGATLTATAGDATGTSAISAGVYGDITSSGALTATGGAATVEGATSYGMYHTGTATGWLTAGTFQGDTAAIHCTGADVTITSLLASEKVGYADKDTKLVTGEENLKAAKYLKVLALHTVTFNANGHGTAPASQTVNHGDTVADPGDLTAEGYTFGGWYTSTDNGTTLSATEYDFDTPVTDDVTLYAKWTIKSYTVTFNANGHGTAPEQQTVNHGEKATDPGDLTAEGYTFGGWYTSTDGGTTLSATKYDFDTPVTDNVTLYAKWTIKSYTVTFDVNDHGTAPASQTVNHGDTVADPGDLTAEGYTFGGWYTSTDNGTTLSATEYDFDTPVTDDVTLYAKWTIKSYTVTFNANGHGDAPEQQTVNHGEKATDPGDLTAEGYTFGGWYTSTDNGTTLSATEYDFDTPVTADLDLYAKWTIKSYTVIFNANGHGTAPESQTVNHGEKATDPGDLTAEGYTFGGWYWDAGFAEGSKANFPYTVEDDVTFYALWTEADDGGSDPDDGGSDPDDGGSSPDDGGSDPDDGGSSPDDGGNGPDDGGSSPGDGGNDPGDGGSDPDDGGNDPDDGGNDPDDGGNGPDNAEEEPACPQDETCPIAAFGDVDSAGWYHEGLHYCIENGLMIGVSDTEFMPHGLTTRGMIVTILYRLEGKPEVTTTGTFSDVADGLWYTEAVEWAAANGIVEGDGENFYPEANLTREQMATILYRYAQYKGVDVTVGEDAGNLDFTDADQVSEWAYPALQWACTAGLYQGDDNGLLRPGDNLERCEMATLIFRLCENILK